EPDGGCRQAAACGAPLGIRAAADVPVAHEHNARDVLPTDPLPAAIPSDHQLAPCEHQACESTMTAVTRTHPDRVRKESRSAERRGPFGSAVHPSLSHLL